MTVVPSTFYSSLAELLRAWRKQFGMSQEAMADKIHVSSREWRRWEALGGKASIPGDENLGDISEATGIPYAVLMALASHRPIPIFYSLRRQMYSFVPDGLDESVIDYLERIGNSVHDQDLIATLSPIRSKREVENIRKVQERFGIVDRAYSPEFMLACAAQMPHLNVHMRDVWGHYTGHAMTALISPQASHALLSGDMHPMDLCSRDLRRVDQPFAMFAMTIHASHRGVMMKLLRHYFRWLRGILISHGDCECLAYMQGKQAELFYRRYGFETIRSPSPPVELDGTLFSPVIAQSTLTKIVGQIFGEIGSAA